MEDCLKKMNIENDSLKGKLGNVISNINTPEEKQYLDDNEIVNSINNEDDNDKLIEKKNNEILLNQKELKQKKCSYKNKKESNLSNVNNDTLEDLRNRFKNNRLNNNSDYLSSHFRGASAIPFENYYDNINDSEGIISENEENPNSKATINSSSRNQKNMKNRNTHRRENSGGMLKWSRHLTLGKSGQNQMFSNNEENNNEEISNRNNFKNNFENIKVNPFVDNTSTFINNDYENMNEKISNLENIEDENSNNEEEEEMDNVRDVDGNFNDFEGYYEFENKSEFPLQLKMRGCFKKRK